MNAKELRIGNYVLFSNKIKTIDLSDFGTEWTGDLGRKMFDQFKPIPLSADWLIEFGIKKSGNHYFFKTNTGNAAYFSEEFKLIFSDFERSKIKYVHELQNLYFALTGEELKLASDSAQP